MNRSTSQERMAAGLIINSVTRLLHEDKHKFVSIERPDGVIEMLFIPKEEKWIKRTGVIAQDVKEK